MDKVLLSDLKKKILIRSALISLSSLDEILGLNDMLSSDEILLELIKKALREFELTNPLILDMKINRNQMKSCSGLGLEGYMEIKNNFTLFLDCTKPLYIPINQKIKSKIITKTIHNIILISFSLLTHRS